MHITRLELLEMAGRLAVAAAAGARQNDDASGLDAIARRAGDTIRACSAEGRSNRHTCRPRVG